MKHHLFVTDFWILRKRHSFSFNPKIRSPITTNVVKGAYREKVTIRFVFPWHFWWAAMSIKCINRHFNHHHRKHYNTMKIEELKKIPIWELLSHLGIEPVSKRSGGAQLMYHSPLRPDRNASFSVSTRKNLWMDFGTSQGGNVIDLAIALKGYCTFSEAVTWLEEQARCSTRISCTKTSADMMTPICQGSPVIRASATCGWKSSPVHGSWNTSNPGGFPLESASATARKRITPSVTANTMASPS